MADADRGQAARAERARKVAAVMRENLKKRKAQDRARATDGPEAAPQMPGIGQDGPPVDP